MQSIGQLECEYIDSHLLLLDYVYYWMCYFLLAFYQVSKLDFIHKIVEGEFDLSMKANICYDVEIVLNQESNYTWQQIWNFNLHNLTKCVYCNLKKQLCTT